MLLHSWSNIPLEFAAGARLNALRTRQAGAEIPSTRGSRKFQSGHSVLRTHVATGESASSTSVEFPARTDSTQIGGATSQNINGNGSCPRDVDDGRVVTTFRWPSALGGQDVSVVGSFTEWETPVLLRRSAETNDFIRTIALQPGTYQYKFKVDGEWTTSPVDAITGDGKGMFNNQRLVAPSAIFHWKAAWGGQEVFVTGDFAGWAELLPLKEDAVHGGFHLACSLPPGTYSYQYLVDGTWMTSPDAPVGPDDDGHLCNKMTVEVPLAWHIFYATGWENAVVKCRVLDADGTPQASGWQEYPMQNTPSRAVPSGGAWKMAVVPATTAAAAPGGAAPQLEFIVADGAGNAIDQPAPGANYMAACPGGFKLQHGRLRPFPRARSAPSMLVSDLDGTMVGDGPEADAGTAAFCAYWEDAPALTGSVLVYNTGRSLGQFKGLWAEKGGALALPDVLITAVGTKIFLLDVKEQDRSRADGQMWKEDAQWARILDEGWDLGRVKQVMAEAIDAVGAEYAQWLDDGLEHPHRIALMVVVGWTLRAAGMRMCAQVAAEVIDAVGAEHAQWLDDGSEHPHRIALMVAAQRVPEVCARLQQGFAQHDVQVRIIESGTGGGRYVDCVSIRGGKLEALERVRTLFSVPRDRCCAAGDSGNDILMLEGANPAIVVGNAQPTLVDWLVRQPQNSRVVLTDAEIARGILEGLARHGLY